MVILEAMDDETLKNLRLIMSEKRIDLWLETGEDPHISEYPPGRWRSREAVSGFTGSAGTLMISKTGGALFSDSRYWLQAPAELIPGIVLQKSEMNPDADIFTWIETACPSKGIVGVDPFQISWARFQNWRQRLKAQGKDLHPFPDMLDACWTQRPDYPEGLIRDFEKDCSVEGRLLKLDRFRGILHASGAHSALIASLDEIAWCLNLRGADIENNPLFLSYLVLKERAVYLFCQPGCLEPGLESLLNEDGIQIRPYREIGKELPVNLAGWQLTFEKLPAGLLLGLSGIEKALQVSPGPLALMKAVKSPAELDGFREAMKRDGRTMVRFMRWWESHVTETETSIAAKLWDLREGEGAWIPSFDTIAGWNANGAIVHYNPGQMGMELVGDGLLLLDSGAHYPMGTTDITRVLYHGTVRQEWKSDYTLVLRAYIALVTSCFPEGTKGYQLDPLARSVLWGDGKTYGHGTGHGVGHVLSVHEGPAKISTEPVRVPLIPGMVLSHEPGLYRTGMWGIRLENLAVVETRPSNEFGSWLGWETLTLAPFEPSLVEASLLNSKEKNWVLSYHKKLVRELTPGLDPEDTAWLQINLEKWEQLFSV